MSFEQAGQQASTIIKTEEGFFMCSDPQCLKFPAGLGQSQDMSQMLTGPLDEMKKSAQEVQTRSAGKRSIAGTKASCFEANITDGQGLLCLSDEGVPLLTEFQSAEGSFKMVVTEYTTSVSDDVFDLPYPVQELPTGFPVPVPSR